LKSCIAHRHPVRIEGQIVEPELPTGIGRHCPRVSAGWTRDRHRCPGNHRPRRVGHRPAHSPRHALPCGSTAPQRSRESQYQPRESQSKKSLHEYSCLLRPQKPKLLCGDGPSSINATWAQRLNSVERTARLNALFVLTPARRSLTTICYRVSTGGGLLNIVKCHSVSGA
jgi:hypothetical protein